MVSEELSNENNLYKNNINTLFCEVFIKLGQIPLFKCIPKINSTTVFKSQKFFFSSQKGVKIIVIEYG